MTTKGPDAEKTAREILDERSGGEAPPASSPPTKSKHGGARKGAGRKKGTGKKSRTSEEPEGIGPEEEAAFAVLASVTWNTAAGIFKFDKLEEEESAALGKAIAPVVRKYAPGLDEWAPEFTLALVLVGLMEKKGVFKIGQKKEEGPDLELVPPTSGDE